MHKPSTKSLNLALLFTCSVIPNNSYWLLVDAQESIIDYYNDEKIKTKNEIN